MTTDSVQLQSKTIDVLRPLMAVMVVGLHVRPFYADGTETFFTGIYEASVITIFRVLFSIAVPVFFLISGYLFFNKLEDWDSDVWKSKLKKRIGTLLVPYLLWNVIAFLGFILTRKAGQIVKGNAPIGIVSLLDERGWLRLFWDRCLYGDIRPESVNLFGIAVSTGTPMNEPTWFLRDLMVVILFSPVIYFLIKKFGKLFILLTAILFCVDLWIPFPGFSSKSFFMFSVGAWFCINRKNMLSAFCRFPLIESVFALVFLFVASISFNNSEWIYCLSSRFYLLFAIPAVFCFVSRFVAKHDSVNLRCADYIGSSFFVYLVHTVLITETVCWVMSSICSFDNQMVKFVLLVLSTFAVYFISHGIYLIMKKITRQILAVLVGNRIPLKNNSQ